MTAAALPGPLDLAPDITLGMAAEMLDDVLASLPWGVWDAEVRTYLQHADPAYQAAVASWCRRSWAAGVEVGRAECTEEVEAYHRAVQAARAELDAVKARQT